MESTTVNSSSSKTITEAIYLFILLSLGCIILVVLILGLWDCACGSNPENIQIVEQKDAADHMDVEMREKYRSKILWGLLSFNCIPHLRKMKEKQEEERHRLPQTNLGGASRTNAQNSTLGIRKATRPSSGRSNTSKTLRFEEPLPSSHNDFPKLSCENPRENALGQSCPDGPRNDGEFENYHQFVPFIEENINVVPKPSMRKGVEPDEEIVRYSYRELADLEEKFDLPAINVGEKVRTSQLLTSKASLPIPTSVSDDYLNSIKELILESEVTHRRIGLFQLVAVGAFLVPFTNPIHFNKVFCFLMMHAIDMLKIYNDTASTPILQVYLVDLGCCFLWEHWDSKIKGTNKAYGCFLLHNQNKKTSRMNELTNGLAAGHSVSSEYQDCDADFERTEAETKAEDLNGLPSGRYRQLSAFSEVFSEEDQLSVIRREPDLPNARFNPPIEVGQIIVTFRLMCNMFLGTPALAKEVRSYCIFKISNVFRACAARAPCDQHPLLLPLVELSINNTRRDDIKSFFYDIFTEIVLHHLGCCIKPAYIFAPNSIIQSLVVHGLVALQPLHVRNQAGKLKTIIARQYRDARLWGTPISELDDGRGFAAPGGWYSPA